MSIKVTLCIEPDSFLKLYDTKDDLYLHNALDLIFSDHSTVTVHDFVISSKCEYFAGLLKTGFKESLSREISLKDEQDDIKSIQKFLQLLYGKSLLVDLEQLVKIWQAANRFRYNKIKIIEAKLLENAKYLDKQKLNNLLFESESEIDVASFLDQISLNELNIIKGDIEDPKMLREIIAAVIRRYKGLAVDIKKSMTKVNAVEPVYNKSADEILQEMFRNYK